MKKTPVTITYAQLRDINPIGWFARYVAIHVREVDYVKTKNILFVVVNLLSLIFTSKS